VLGTVALLFLYPRMQAVKVVGTDIAHAVPLTAVAGMGHMALGTVDFVLLGSLLLGSLPGIYIGSHLSAKVPEKVLRPSGSYAADYRHQDGDVLKLSYF
jgi:uncharacterized membrane protein YfcA